MPNAGGEVVLQKARTEAGIRAPAPSLVPRPPTLIGDGAGCHGRTCCGPDERDETVAVREVEHLGFLVHELRSSLSSALLALHAIKKGTVGIGGRTSAVMERSLLRMRDLIDRSLTEVRLRADAELQPERLPLADLIAETEATATPEADWRGLAFVVEIERDVEIEADRQMLISVVANLVQNAIKYTPHGGHVTLRGFAEQGLGLAIRKIEPGIRQRSDRSLVGFDRAVQTSEMKGRASTGLALLASLGVASSARAQHDHPRPARHARHEDRPLGLSMSRQGSGTSWQPDASPVNAVHAGLGEWKLMIHGLLFAGVNVQGGDRGDEQLSAPSWLMLMAHRPVGESELAFRAMLSFDAAVMGERGYPLLLQTGESVDGEPLVDRQHPHDLFMELAGMYTALLGERFAVQLYGGPAAEPALGPVAYPHRRSAMFDPLAPLSHHWQDSTHISFGVATLGVMTRRAKLEACVFNGREPDEHRFDLDLRSFDSYSARLSVNPNEHWSGQVSFGDLETPEGLEPEIGIRRATASIMHVGSYGPIETLAATAVWGRNNPSDGEASDSFLIESSFELGDLGLEGPMDEEKFPVGSFVLGYVHDFGPTAGLVPGIGARGAINVVGDELESIYGTRTPVGAMVVVRLEPTPAAASPSHAR
jgi:hypothetical protein